MDHLGQEGGLPQRLKPEDEAKFPNLRNDGYVVDSLADGRYNCIAHAADDKHHKWDCPQLGYFWPSEAVFGDDIEALVNAFRAIGYEECADGVPEEGYEKVALYADTDGFWSHAAKQKNGNWSSKLGEIEDILHRSPHAVSSDSYGQVARYMRRSLSVAHPPLPVVVRKPVPRGRKGRKRKPPVSQ